MKNTISRRSFIAKAALAGLFSLLPVSLPGSPFSARGRKKAGKIALAGGNSVYENTRKLMEALGGISRFVKKGRSVGLLVNSDFDHKGAYVHPDIPLAVIKACFDARAGEVICIQNIELKYWERSDYYDTHKVFIEKLTNYTFNRFPSKFQEEFFIKREVDGVSLKKVEIVKGFFDCDVLMNISIAKHHASSLYTGALKNTMGVTTRDTNVTFHLGGPTRNDPGHLAQCIADLNKLRLPDLTLVDASEVLISNGPAGPGELLQPGKIIGGTDIVAVDSLASTIIGHEYGEIPTIRKAYETGLGEMDFTRYEIINV